MAAVARIIIEVDDKGAISAVRGLGAETDKLEPAFQKMGQRGNVVFTDLTKQQQRARDATSLFARTLGVELPRQLERVISKSALLGPAMSAAFNVAVVAGFGLAIVSLIGKIPELVERIFDWTGALKANTEAQKALNPLLIDQEKQLRALNAQYKLIGLEGSRQMAQSQQNIREEIARTKDELKSAGESFEALRKQAEAPKVGHPFGVLAGKLFPNKEQVKQATELTDKIALLGGELKTLQAQLRNAGKEYAVTFSNEQTQKLLTQNEIATMMGLHIGGLVLGFRDAGFAAKFAEQNIARVNQELARLPELDAKRRQARIDALEEIGRIERETAVAMLPPWLRADAEIALSAQERAREIMQSAGHTVEGQRLAAAQTAQVWAVTFAQMRDRMADSLEGLFDDITSGNIGRRFLDNFKRLVFQMISEWILGMAKMRGASAGIFSGGAGGILGAIFSGLLGIPNLFGASKGVSSGTSAASAAVGGLSSAGAGAGISGLSFGNGLSGPGAAFPGLPLGPGTAAAASVLSLGAGLSAGAGVGSPLSLPAGASLGARFAAGLGGLIPGGLLSLAQLMGFGGAGQGAVSGALTAAGLGGVFAVAAGAAHGVGALASLGAFFSSALGAATLGIGAIVGLLFGIFGGRKKKRERERLEHQLMGEINKVEDAYKNHQIDFDSTLAQLEQLRAQFVDAQRNVGGGPHRRVHSHIDRAEKEIRAIEDERKRRQEVVFGPAEFHRGGFVSPFMAMASPGRRGARSFHSGDVVNANLLVGESVLNRAATRQVGRAGVELLNSGRGGGGSLGLGSVTFEIYAIDSQSFADYLKRGGDRVIFEMLRRAQAEGAIN